MLLEALKRKTRMGKFFSATNVSWDANLISKEYISVYGKWVDEIIDLAKFYENTANFIFRCHPAQVTKTSQDTRAVITY